MFYFTCNESKIYESFTFRNNLQEKNELFHDILIHWDAPVYMYVYIYIYIYICGDGPPGPKKARADFFVPIQPWLTLFKNFIGLHSVFAGLFNIHLYCRLT